MTGGACGVLVPGDKVGTTEWERPARLKFRCLTGRAADALGGAGANGRPGVEDAAPLASPKSDR